MEFFFDGERLGISRASAIVAREILREGKNETVYFLVWEYTALVPLTSSNETSRALQVRLHGADGVTRDLDSIVLEGPDATALRPRAPLRARTLRMVISDFLSPADPTPRLKRLVTGASHL